jgi:hypothetical protein
MEVMQSLRVSSIVPFLLCCSLSFAAAAAWAQGTGRPEDKAIRQPGEAVEDGVRLLPKRLPEDPLADLPGELPEDRGRWAPDGDEPELFAGPQWESPVDGRTPGLLGGGNSDSVLDTPLESDVDADEAERQRVLAGDGDDPGERFLGQDALDSGDSALEQNDGNLGSEFRDPVEW